MHYLDTAQDAADSAARSDRATDAAQHRNDATRHDVTAVAGGCSVSTWYNDTAQTWGCDVMDRNGLRVGGGCGWRMASEADAAGWAMIEEGV